MFYLNKYIKLIFFLVNFAQSDLIEIDPNGYIAYCPCMGRFGNQADHFLGALGFAHGINRTLILPPWVEYRKGEIKSIQVPFDEYFRVDKLEQFHKVITMEKFMKDLGEIIWPPNKRISFCYMARKGIGGVGSEETGCNAKNGNPFGPFWDTFGIDFVNSEFYEPLHYDVHHRNMGVKWAEKYPGNKWPVIAFTGAPASFPVQEDNLKLHKHLVWNDNILNKARTFIKTNLPKGSFLGIHLRNGIDWVRACEHISTSPNLFSSAQCLGYQNEKGSATMEMCFPTKELIIRQIKRVIKNFKETNPQNELKSIFVASDSNHMIGELNDGLRRLNVIAYKYDENNPLVDLAILGLSNHFIGNCISSFTAFVKRERDTKSFPSSFWAYPPSIEKIKSTKKSNMHEEL